MRLNLPILDSIMSCNNLLIAGMGGGFDIFCGLPIFFELQQLGKQAHLANLTFSNILFSPSAQLQGTIPLTSTLAGVQASTQELPVYCPELYLCQWFQEQQQNLTIWCFKKTGVRPLFNNYCQLIQHLKIDGILLIDGGVDSLSRGDEAQMGTVLEDAISLAAVSQLEEIPLRLMGCLGMGAEREITHAHILENIADLTQADGFLGSCGLIKSMKSYQLYESAVLYVQSKAAQEPSVINSSIISSVRGNYGNYHLTSRTHGSDLWISPLMSLYWFFELSKVIDHHLFLSELVNTETIADATCALLRVIQARSRRPVQSIPLP